MKKLTLLAVAALAISFASCKKDYTCKCTTTYAGGGSGTSTTIIKGVSSKAAKANCISAEFKDENGVTAWTDNCTLSK